MPSNHDMSLAPTLSLVPHQPTRFWAPLAALLARLARPASTARNGIAAPARAAAADMPMYEQAFTTQTEALAWSAKAVAQGYRTVVEQNVYDYSWQVDVYPGVDDDAGRAPVRPAAP